jgi:hypothetical protein
MKARCSTYGEYGFPNSDLSRPRVDFRLVVATDPLSMHLHDILRYALCEMMTGGCLLLDIPLNRTIAEFLVRELVSIPKLSCSLASVESGSPKAIHIAYVPLVDTYLTRGGMLIFDQRHYWRGRGIFRKPKFGIDTIDDLASAMEAVSRELGQSSGSPAWNVRRLKLPSLS